jgi:hypothetical protein
MHLRPDIGLQARHRQPRLTLCATRSLPPSRMRLAGRAAATHRRTLMMKLTVPLALVFAAGAAFACPGSDKMKDAKADQSPAITAAVAEQARQSKALVEKKDVKPAEVKKPTS